MDKQPDGSPQFLSAGSKSLILAALLLAAPNYCLSEEAQAMSPQRFPTVIEDRVFDQADVQTPAGHTMHCEIRGTLESGLLNLRSIVLADSYFTGSYSFNLFKRGSSGNSSTAQRGTFTLSPNEAKLLGMITVNVSEGNTYQAELQVVTDDSDLVCSFAFG
jgi:hypothetical protein